MGNQIQVEGGSSASGGGGGGYTTTKLAQSVTPGSTISVVVGHGGRKGNDRATGGSGIAIIRWGK